MRRRIQDPRVILLDCPLDYKKAKSQTNMKFSIEEQQIKDLFHKLLEFKPDLVITEKAFQVFVVPVSLPSPAAFH
jgi:T-complex protein 1 subunit gamma